MSFNKDYLCDGPWRVLWKTNTAWQRYFDPLNSVADNRAYQWYKEVRRTEGCRQHCSADAVVSHVYRLSLRL